MTSPPDPLDPLDPAPTLAPPARPSACDIVFYGVVRGLEAQRFVPGQRLVEVDLASQFGVGRNAVREAVQRLAADGIVDLVRHKGVVIKSLDAQETMDILEVAERMTGLLARSAARGIRAGQSVEGIGQALEQLRAAEHAEDSEAFARARRSFYRALLQASASLALKRLFPSIQMPVVYAQYMFSALQKLRLRDYALIGQAVIDADEDAADTLGAQHVQHVRAQIQRKIDGLAQRPGG